MILVDTSIWVDHLRSGDDLLKEMLYARKILGHPFVTGELAVGRLRDRDDVLAMLKELPRAIPALNEEVLDFISSEGLFGLGIGYIDAHLLASAQLTPKTLLWTRDKRMLAIASSLSLSFNEA